MASETTSEAVAHESAAINDAAKSDVEPTEILSLPDGMRDKTIEWIEASADPQPTIEDTDRKVKEWFGSKYGCLDDYFIQRAHEIRTLNGPPKKDNEIMLPGYGLPITYKIHSSSHRFPFLYGLRDLDWKSATLTNREICMLQFIEEITNKPDWWIKIQAPLIADKWRREVLGMPWGDYQQNGDFTEKMADACLKELIKKAEIYEKTGLIPVMDHSACAIKSDTLLTNDLTQSLKNAVASLENVPEWQKDWHPGSDGKVLDLVHPSLWPLVYGLSRIIPDKRITLENCLDDCGAGVALAEPVRPPLYKSVWGSLWNYEESEQKALSSKFQWLPCDVDLTGEHPRIVSYINNLHPVHHSRFYPIIEKSIEKSLVAWDIVLRSTLEEFDVERVEKLEGVEYTCGVPHLCGNANCEPSNRPGQDTDSDEDYGGDEAYEENERLDEEWFRNTHQLRLPEAKSDLDDLVPFDISDFQKPGIFDEDVKRIQVIVKLANIQLTPEKPTYDGGSWHVEGQFNEHICATALYYYDCDNITDSYLSFRTQADREDLTCNFRHRQSDHKPIEKIFSLSTWATTMQDIGSVLTREGRALFFPNVYQHRVSPFELADKTRPGHRKILALFLVDPNIEVISTANVPPQQQDWWVEKAEQIPPLAQLPDEIREMVRKNVDFPISEEVAKDLRKELMAERTVLSSDSNKRLDRTEWSFCEH